MVCCHKDTKKEKTEAPLGFGEKQMNPQNSILSQVADKR